MTEGAGHLLAEGKASKIADNRSVTCCLRGTLLRRK